MKKQGQNQYNGQTYRQEIAKTLKDKGISFRENQDLNFVTIYGKKDKPDFNAGRFAIKAVFQTTSGSAEQKHAFFVENIKAGWRLPGVIIFGGEGASPESKTWTKKQVDGEKLLGVFTSIDEFSEWLDTPM